ncbi:MAG: heme exporter protein CcmB [Acidimicrobiales bacterium]
MIRDALLIAGKDLRVEWRSRVVTNQVAPFTLLIVVLFGFALDADTETLRDTAPGLFWVAVLLVAVLAVQRSASIETADNAQARVLLSDIDAPAVFLGKALALLAQLLVLEAGLLVAVVVLFDVSVADPVLVVLAALAASVGIAAAGTIYGVLALGLGARETLLPILLLPVLAPVLISATRVFGDAFERVDVDGWAWLAMLTAFAAIQLAFGLLTYGVLLEES